MRKKSNTIRLQILNAAKAAFEQEGFEGASMDYIAEHSQVAKATIYNYFKSKDVLFLEVIEQTAGKHIHVLPPSDETPNAFPAPVLDIFRILEKSSNVEQALQTFGEHAIEAFYTPSMLASRRMIIGASSKSDIGKLFFERGPAEAFKKMEAFFAAAIATGKLREADPRVVAAHWRGLLTAEFFDSVLYNALPPPSGEEIKATTARAVTVFMKAYGVQDPIE